MTNSSIATVSEKLPEVRHMKPNRLEDSLFSKELAPHYMQLAAQLAKSEMVPKVYRGKPQDLFVAMAMGYQIGLSVEQSIQAIAVINGKPCLWGDDMLALCMNHPDFMDIVEEPIMSNTNTVMGYRCTVKRKFMTDHSEVFDLNMAKKAGLLGKVGPWTQYPERMMKLRARGFALRDRFPDALKGIKSREEVEDYIDADYKVADQGTSSRTEMLKKDFLTKTGKLNAEETDRPLANMENSETVPEADHGQESQPVDKDGEETARLHIEIRKRLDEIGFTEERIAKALAYYEVDSIESLSTEAAQNFFTKLDKL